MWVSDRWTDYELIDCGRGEKLERWGDQLLVRPDPQAIWNTPRTHPGLEASARAVCPLLHRRRAVGEEGHAGALDHPLRRPHLQHQAHELQAHRPLPGAGGQLGLCPRADPAAPAGPSAVLNLFAYTGGATVACAAAGASVCHVDAARGMVSWARENARSSGLEDAPIRWIVDDCAKFVEREIRRGRQYDAIIMDPPSYGRGPTGEVWKLEENLYPFVELVTRGAVRPAPVRHPQLLYHRSGPQR